MASMVHTQIFQRLAASAKIKIKEEKNDASYKEYIHLICISWSAYSMYADESFFFSNWRTFIICERAMSANPKPTIYRNLYENMGPELNTWW